MHVFIFPHTHKKHFCLDELCDSLPECFLRDRVIIYDFKLLKCLITFFITSNCFHKSLFLTIYYLQTKFGASDPNIDKRKHRILSNSNRTNNMIFPSKNQASDSSSLKGRGGLSRKSSFSYVPSTERLSRTNSIVNHVEKNNLNFQEG